jgi:hypothetical protein
MMTEMTADIAKYKIQSAIKFLTFSATLTKSGDENRRLLIRSFKLKSRKKLSEHANGGHASYCECDIWFELVKNKCLIFGEDIFNDS